MLLKVIAVKKLWFFTIGFLIKKSYKDLVIYFTRYNPDKSVAILNLYYVQLLEKIEEYEGKNI